MTHADTIFALSSGQPPSAIAIVRISGPKALETLGKLTSTTVTPRRATMAELRADGELLDQALVLRFDGPNTATGEDLAELHLHGGRAVVAGVLRALATMDGLRPAEPGEFTRRAFLNARIDLAEAEGLADLLQAETETQRRAALQLAGGALGRQIDVWTQRLLWLAGTVEAQLDFSDEGDVEAGLPDAWHHERQDLEDAISAVLARPPAERLRDGVRVVIAGPPNSGKSTLLNALVGREAAITSEIPGTTRDLIEAPVAIDGVPLLLIDSAGLRDTTDQIETVGVDRAQTAIASADIVLWLGVARDRPLRPQVLVVSSKSDLGPPVEGGDLSVSAVTGAGMVELSSRLVDHARSLLPGEGEVALNARHREVLAAAAEALSAAGRTEDPIIIAEELRQARRSLDRVTGRAGVEDMLDALFARFCIGK